MEKLIVLVKGDKELRKKGDKKMKRLVQVVAVLVLLFVFAGNCFADNMMAMRWFSQIDPNWRNDQMGTSGNTIGGAGCTMTCVAMAMNYYGVSTTPRELNQWLSNHGGYTAGGLLDWEVLDDYSEDVVDFEGRIDDDDIVDNNRLYQELDAGRPVLLEVNAFGGHFILAVGRIGITIYIVDPAFYPASLSTLADSYVTYTGMRLLSGPAQVNRVGYFNGWNSTVSPLFVDCFGYHGGGQTFGLPVSRNIDSQQRPDTVWEWEVCYFQVFDGGDLGECAIGYDRWENSGEAFPMHGQIWRYYKENGGPYLLLDGIRVGGPVGTEYYATDDYTGHQLVVQEMANGFLVYDTVIGVVDVRTKANNGFTLAYEGTVTIALAPTPTLNPLDAHRIEVLIPDIMNRAYADVFCEDVFVNRMYEDKYVIEGLESSTVYH
ncbi:C39 family peptidase, partial [Patescibacteria group bacterium]|nr:C39 family peptidase [Patescibacteria group bacterium]